MSYIGNTPDQQAFSPAIDYFSGNGSTVAFTLSRPVVSVAQVQVVVNNVDQNPSTAFTVSGNTLTFTGAPSSGTNNIYVYYTSPITQVIQPGQGTVGALQLVDSSVTPAKLSTGAPTWDTSSNVTIVGTVKPAAMLSPNSGTIVTADNAMPATGSSLLYTLAQGPSTNDGHTLGMSWSTASLYGAQLWFDTDPTYQTAFRQRSSVGVWNSWSYLYHSNNYKVYTSTVSGSTSTNGSRGSVSITLNSASNKVLVFGSDLLRCSSGVVRGILQIDGSNVEAEFMYQQVNGNIWQTTTGIYTANNLSAGTHTVGILSDFTGSAGAFDGPTYLQVLVWDGI